MTNTRIVLAGHGKMGGVYAKCLQETIALGSPFTLAVADRNPERLVGLPANIPTFSGEDAIRAALRAAPQGQPQIVLLATNDKAHLQNFEDICADPSVVRILAEKPLTPTMTEAERLLQIVGNRPVTVNTISNFSAIIPDFMAAKAACVAAGGKLVHVDAIWGKDRTKDARPTTGVIACDLIHPLDLVYIFADGKNMRFVGGDTDYGQVYLKDDGLGENKPCIYRGSFQAIDDTAGTTFSFESSYAALRQERSVTATYQMPAGNFRAIQMQFDVPEDSKTRKNLQDHLFLYDVAADRAVLTDHVVRGSGDLTTIPASLRPFGKQACFVWHSLAQYQGLPHDRLTDLNEGIALQRLIDVMQTAKMIDRQGSEQARATKADFRTPLPSQQPIGTLVARSNTIRRLAGGFHL